MAQTACGGGKMTDNEIIKGFECHTQTGCAGCPFMGKGCSQKMNDEVFELLNRLKIENENHKTAFKESIADMLSEYSNVLVGKMLLAKEHTINSPNKEDSLEYIRGKAEAFETAVKLIDKELEEMVG
jgi:hypothetical protein